MKTNKMIVFVLTVGVVAAIPLFNRVAHSHPGNSSLAISQTPGTTPPAGGSVNSSNTEVATTPETAPEHPRTKRCFPGTNRRASNRCGFGFNRCNRRAIGTNHRSRSGKSPSRCNDCARAHCGSPWNHADCAPGRATRL
jgi:hypothetical protein